MHAFSWTPSGLSAEPPGSYVAREAHAHMHDGSFKPARRSEWFEVRSFRVRLTLVDPGAETTVSLLGMGRWLSALRSAVSFVDSLCGAAPERPCAVDVLVYLWDGEKVLLADEREISSKNANTGVSTVDSRGRAGVLVYRKEEAVKTLVHELLHVFGVGAWANDDSEVQAACSAMFRGSGLIRGSGLSSDGSGLSSTWSATEAIVDALAIRLTVHLFGGCSWEDCVAHAERLSRRLVGRCLASGGVWKQSTSAFEYYCVKPALMRRMDEVLVAHRLGLRRPDKAKMRDVFRAGLTRAVSFTPVEPVRMRMTPLLLAPAP